MKNLKLFYSSFFNMVHLTILILIFQFYCTDIYCQNSIECGILPVHHANSTNLDSIVFDRFGNTYDIYPKQYANLITCNNSGYYELSSDNNLPPDMEDCLCRTFNEMSLIFPRRINYTACGDPILQEPVRILIQLFSGGPKDAGAASQLAFAGYSSQCTSGGFMGTGKVYDKINGGSAKFDGDFVDGILSINTNINWNFDYFNDPINNKTDFRTAIKHEILHLMGIESNIKMDGTADFERYTMFDKYLGVIPYFNSNSTFSSLVGSNCKRNCFNFSSSLFQGPDGFQNNVYNNCNSNNSDFDIVFQNPLIPISGNRGVIPIPPNPTISQFKQMLSHFNESCNGFTKDYIMQPELMPNIRRPITNEELEVMCTLGYQTSTCNGCYNINYAEEELVADHDDFGCCDKLYFTCKNKPISIPLEDLICNNAFALGVGHHQEVTDVFTNPLNDPNIDIDFDPVVGTLNITILNSGKYSIFYTTTDCDCKMNNAKFEIYVTPCLNCNSSNSCNNISRTNGFEEFDSGGEVNYGIASELSNGVYWEFVNSYTNSVDICQLANGNKYLHMAYDNDLTPQVHEGICLYLCEAVPNLCSLTLSFDGASYENSANLRVFGSLNPPCMATDTRINLGETSTNCLGHVYNPTLIQDFELKDGTANINPPCLEQIDFTHYTYTFTNNTGNDIRYITIYPDEFGTITHNSIFLDNVKVSKHCPINTNFTFTIDCRNVEFTGTPNVAGYEYIWDFGDGNISSSTTNVISHNYTNNGTYQVTLKIKDECGVTESIIKNVVINCNVQPICPCANNSCTQIGGQGITTKVDNNGVILPDIQFGCANICGVLDVNRNFNIAFADLYMGPGAQIIVRSGITLNITLATISGCTTMWQGITLENGAHISMQFVTLSDAEYGLDCHGTTTLDVLNGVSFINNYVGIHSPSTGGTGIGNTINTPFFGLVNFNFTSFKPFFSGQNPMPQIRTFAGIELNNGYMVIDGTSSYTNLQNGIVGRNSFIISSNCTMNNIVPNTWPAGDANCYPVFQDADGFGVYVNFGILVSTNNSITNSRGGIVGVRSYMSATSNTISGTYYGVYNLNSIFGPVNISQNTISDFIFRGIRIIDPIVNIWPRVVSNTLTASQSNLADQSDCSGSAINLENVHSRGLGQIENNPIILSPSFTGIQITECSNLGLQSNNIQYQNNTSSAINDGVSIVTSTNCYVYSNEVNGLSAVLLGNSFMQSSSSSIKYCCNTSDYTQNGYSFSGSNSNPTRLFSSEINHHTNGVLVNNFVEIGQQFDHGNQWLEVASNNGFNAKNLNTTNQALINSQFTCLPCQSSFWPMAMSIFPAQLNCSTNLNDWFIRGEANGLACPTSSCTPLVFPKLRIFGFPFIVGNPQIDGNNDRYIATRTDNQNPDAWEAKKDLLVRLIKNPQLIGLDAVIDSFYTANLNTNLYKFSDAEVEMEKANNLNESDELVWFTLHDNILEKWNLIDSVNELIKSASNLDDSLLLFQLKYQYELDLRNLVSGKLELLTNIISSIESKVDLVALQNSLIVPSSVFQNNEKNINNLILSTLSKGDMTFTSTQVSELTNLASQCIHTGGKSVDIARRVILYDHFASFNDDNLCGNNQAITTSTSEKKLVGEIEVVPNPTNGKFDIILPDLMPARIELVSSEGKVIYYQSDFKLGLHEFKIDLLLNQGIYYVKVKTIDGKILMKKFVVQK